MARYCESLGLKEHPVGDENVSVDEAEFRNECTQRMIVLGELDVESRRVWRTPFEY